MKHVSSILEQIATAGVLLLLKRDRKNNTLPIYKIYIHAKLCVVIKTNGNNIVVEYKKNMTGFWYFHCKG